MPPSLELRDIQALTAMQAGLNNFSHAVQDALISGRSDVQNGLEFVQDKFRARQRDLNDACTQVREAEAELNACENSGYYTEDGAYIPPNCSPQQAALNRARQYQQQCETRLEIAHSWQSRLQQAADEYEQVELKLDKLADQHTNQAWAALGLLAARYAAVHSISMAATMPASQVTPRSGSSQWLQRGIQNIPLASLPVPEGISGAADFSKVSESEMRAGLLRLQEMRPVIEDGRGNNSDYWYTQDQQHGLDYANGYQRIYEAFYGSDAIFINKDGDKYNIVNGRHRIWLAKQMGIFDLPMRVVEKS